MKEIILRKEQRKSWKLDVAWKRDHAWHWYQYQTNGRDMSDLIDRIAKNGKIQLSR